MKKTAAIAALIFAVSASLAAISTAQIAPIPATTTLRDTHERLDGLLWMQTSAEYQTLTNIAFNQARLTIDAALADKQWTAALEQTKSYSSLAPAIIVDVDETILDNSRFQGRLIKDRSEYNSSAWKKWTEKRMATVVPGADNFLRYVASKKITIFYVTNREASQESDTRINLIDLKLPLRSDIDVVLSKNENTWTSSDKGARRTHVSKNFRILALVGDDLGDFVSGAKDTPDNRVKLAKAYTNMWGTKWILIPNPLYGSWESALYGHDFKLPDKNVLEMKSKKVQGF